MPLFKVTIERTLVVVARTSGEAECLAPAYAREEDSEPDSIIATPITSIEQVPNVWRNAIPWGGRGDDDNTVEQRLTSPCGAGI